MPTSNSINIKSLCFVLLLFLFQGLRSQALYAPLSVTGFNADVVCSATNCTGTNSIDEQWYYYFASKKTEGALPQSITSKMGIQYDLASFESNNALTIGSNGVSSGTLTLTTPTKAKEIWVLGLSASGERAIDVKLNYTDNSSVSVNFSFPDWYQSNGAKAAYYGLGRVKSSSTYDDRLQFGLFERVIPVDENKTVKSIEFNYNGTDKTYTSIFAVSAYNGGRVADKHLYMISNAHFDTQWDWDVQTSIDQYVKNTLEGNFNLLDKYPNYVFNFEGAIKYMFAKEYYPDLYDKLKTYVASGRWHISGSSVDANDVMVPSAESLIRNFLLGREYFKTEFNVDGGRDVMLPDCFGFPYTLPTLAAHCGVTAFHSQKLSWGSAYDYNSLPHYGLWRGIDGSEIYAVHKPGAYVTQYRENMAYNGDVLNEIFANEQELGAKKTVRYFGTGDRGGSIDESTAEWLEKSLAADGPVKVHVVTPDQFFASITPQERATLPLWDNELPMSVHGVGCYSSHSILKYWNRKGELLADATEKSSVVANWLGALPYQTDVINDAWVRLLWHQFHDDLTGTSIPKAYVFTNNDHVMGILNLSKTLDNSVGAVSRQMDTQVSGTPLVVYNPLSTQREDILEAQIALSTKPNNISVYDTTGNPVATQMLKYENGVLSFIFKATLPSLAYAIYELRVNDNTSASITSNLQITQNTIENDEYLLRVNANGDVNSILDKKQSNKELLKSPIRQSLQQDTPGYWASWEISWGDVDRAPYAYVDGNVQISIEEQGPLRSTLKITRECNGSKFVQFIRMTAGVNEDRIDFINEVDWQTRETMLKVIFPLNASNPNATYDASIGAIVRGNNKSNLHEVAGHQWADITHSDNSYGISILNDCKYGWDKPADNVLRLTLIHTPRADQDRNFQKHQDLGLNKFTYSFYRHMGTWNESTQWAAAKLNQPIVAYEAPKHDGNLGKSFAFANVNTDKAGIKALKKAEASDEIIVRIYELVGDSHNNVEIAFASNVVSAREVNGCEESVGAVNYSGNKISFDINKYQPRTFAVTLAANTAASMPEPESRKAELTYNIDVMSNDNAKRDGRFGSSFFSYPAELFEDEIVSDGIKFAIGSRADKALNAVTSQGQQVDIPQAANNHKLYILAASHNTQGSEVKFLVDGVAKPIKVEYFAEFVGTWGSIYGERNYRKDNIGFTATHRHNYSTNSNDSYSYLYIYKYAIDIDQNARTLTLPDNSDVIVFAVTASNNENDDVTSLTDLKYLPEFDYIESTDEQQACGERLMPISVVASGQTNANERPALAADNNPFTKWNDNSGASKYIQYTFSKPVEICQWNVLHGGIEGDNNISSDFILQYKDGITWVDIDEVTNNTLNRTVRAVNPFTASVVRLRITKPQQDGGTTTRIYSFDLFGASTSSVGNIESKANFQSYVNEKNLIVVCKNKAADYMNTNIQVYNTMGQLLVQTPFNETEIVIAQQLSSGVYIVKADNDSQKVMVGK